MTFYKIIQNNKVVNAGFVFLKWNESDKRFYICGENEAQFVKGYVNETAYHDNWLKPAPQGTKYETAKITVITKKEYDSIIKVIDGGSSIDVLPPDIEPDIEPEPSPDLPISVNKMREIILEQEQRISLLTDCILELSETIYGEE